MKDQYGNETPTDLVLLEPQWIKELSAPKIKSICKLDWYEPVLDKSQVFVSAAKLDEIDLFDCYGPEEF